MKFFCFHDWSKWSKLVNAYAGTRQYRSCNKCNKAGWRTPGSNIDFNLNQYDADISKTKKEAVK